METTAQKSPRLTLVLCSRNDQWQGNSLWRLEATLNYTAAQAAEIGHLEDIEIVVADWGSVETLRDSAKLTPEAMQIVRYLNVPPALAKEKQRDSPFAEVYAINAAARRSRGEYIGRIDQDTLVGKYFLEWFFKAVDSSDAPFPLEKTAMISNRRRIPYDFGVHCPSFPILRKYLDLFRGLLPRMYPPPPERYWECYIGILLLHRDLWQAAGGYDESFIYYGHMEFDFFLRLFKQFPGVDLSDIVRCDFYHLDHISKWVVRDELKRSTNPARSLENPPPVLCPNGDTWGLSDYEIPLLQPPHDAMLPKSAITWHQSLVIRLIFLTALSTIITFYRIARSMFRPFVRRILGKKLISFLRSFSPQRAHR
jgi:hypothetical protein